MPHRTHTRAAFSLIELSIVMVIIGLLVGGILGGQSLIRSSELRSVISDSQKYSSAITQFRDQYNALPGDMLNATNYWGAENVTPTTCRTAPSSSALTCNGNGDGLIRGSTGSEEQFRFWQQLSNAGIIQGNYTGARDGTIAYATTANNSPRGRISNSVWFVYNYGTVTSTAPFFDGTYLNTFEHGGMVTNDLPYAQIFRTSDLFYIDTKLDDGMPGRGTVVIRCQSGLSACTNATSTTDLNATYRLSATGLVGNPVFHIKF